MTSAAETSGPSGGGVRIAGLVVGLVALVGAWLLLPVSSWVISLSSYVTDSGAIGIVVFAAVYIVATVALAPGSLLTLAAGFAWGPLVGTLLVWPTATLASMAAFAIGRFLARAWVARRVAESPRFTAVDRAIAKQGFKIVLLLRLSPFFPFNLLNYALGLTKVTFWRYTLASLVGMLPGTVMYVYLGSLVTSASRLAEGSSGGGAAESVLYWGGLAATLVVTLLITRLARRELEGELSHHVERPESD